MRRTTKLDPTNLYKMLELDALAYKNSKGLSTHPALRRKSENTEELTAKPSAGPGSDAETLI